MLPDPLHPALVHLPLALAVLVPLSIALAVLAIRSGALPGRIWLAVVLLQALLVGSAWLAADAGHDEEERVEQVVAESTIKEHEELAERFLWAGGLVLAIVAAGLLPGVPGAVARVGALLASLLALAAAVQVGHTGGELVYRHGAAGVYLEGGAAAGASSSRGHHEHHE